MNEIAKTQTAIDKLKAEIAHHSKQARLAPTRITQAVHLRMANKHRQALKVMEYGDMIDNSAQRGLEFAQ